MKTKAVFYNILMVVGLAGGAYRAFSNSGDISHNASFKAGDCLGSKFHTSADPSTEAWEKVPLIPRYKVVEIGKKKYYLKDLITNGIYESYDLDYTNEKYIKVSCK